MSGLLEKLAMIVRRDLLTRARYRLGFGIDFLNVLGEVAAFYFLARAVGPNFRPEGMGYFEFLLIGTGFNTLFATATGAFLGAVQDAQRTGTMEVVLTSATPAPLVVFLTSASAFLGRSLHFFVYLLMGFVIFGASLRGANIPGFLLIFVLGLAASMALGIMAAGVQIAIQRGTAVLWLFSSAMWLFAGGLYPVHSLPTPLRWVSHLLPITYALDGIRLALVRGAGFSQLAAPALALAVFCAVLVPLSIFTLVRSLRYARQRGTLSFY